jgi:glycosyltransferase involved in cell wall biosynthesis
LALGTPKLSIITVVYNGKQFLPATLQSISQVKSSDVEYLVVDGASTDGTVELLEENQSLIDIFKSEPDDGIYDAMNKALKLANGRYVLFINAGDEVVPDTINEFLLSNADSDIVYGDALYIDSRGKVLGLRIEFTTRPLPTILTLDSFKMGQGICHQSFIVRRELAPSFDLNYRISADYNWMITCIKRSASNQNLEKPISRFLHGGVSKQQLKKALSERFWIMVKQFGWLDAIWNHFKIFIRGVKFYGRNRRID